ncbi:hypothetical protein ABK040_001568 [Willaertia magna]
MSHKKQKTDTDYNTNNVYFNHRDTTFKLIIDKNDHNSSNSSPGTTNNNAIQILFTETKHLTKKLPLNNENNLIEWNKKDIYFNLNDNLTIVNNNIDGKELPVDLFFEITKFIKDTEIFKTLRFICKQWNEWILTHDLFYSKYKLELSNVTTLNNELLALYFLKWKLFKEKYIFVKSKVDEKLKEKQNDRFMYEIDEEDEEQDEEEVKKVNIMKDEEDESEETEMKDNSEDEDDEENKLDGYNKKSTTLNAEDCQLLYVEDVEINKYAQIYIQKYQKSIDALKKKQLEKDENNTKKRMKSREKEEWIYPVYERNERTREMRRQLMNYLFVLKQEKIVHKFLHIDIKELKSCLFNINGNGNYIIVNFNNTIVDYRQEMTAVEIKFVNLQEELKEIQSKYENLQKDDNNEEEENNEEELYKEEEDKSFKLVSTYRIQLNMCNPANISVDKEILQKAMKFIGLTNDFVNDENCIMDFHMFISTHLAAYFELIESYYIAEQGDWAKLYSYDTD